MSVSLAERRGLRLATFCVLYVAQGIPWGFTAVTLPAYLGAKKLGAAEIGTVLAMTTLPYSFKLVWAPLVDALPSRRFGRRRPWIVGAQLMMALTIGAMIAIPDLTRDVSLLAWMIFIHTIFNSIQDLSTDALAVDLLDEDERARANGFMYASKYAGGILGGAGMSWLIARAGMRTALSAQVGVLLAIMLVPLLVREQPAGVPVPVPEGTVADRFTKLWADLRALARSTGSRAALLCGVMMLASSLAIGLMYTTESVLFTQDLGWSAERYGEITGGPGLAAGVVGAALGGMLADKVGHRRLAALSAIVLAATWIAWALLVPYWHDRTFAYALFVVEPLCESMLLASTFAICMDLSWPAIGATQFAIYMALGNQSTSIGYKLAGAASDWWTYPGIYAVAAAMQLGFVAILPWIDTHAVRRALAAERGV